MTEYATVDGQRLPGDECAVAVDREFDCHHDLVTLGGPLDLGAHDQPVEARVANMSRPQRSMGTHTLQEFFEKWQAEDKGSVRLRWQELLKTNPSGPTYGMDRESDAVQEQSTTIGGLTTLAQMAHESPHNPFQVPARRGLFARLKRLRASEAAPFEGSAQYWDARYSSGGNSGAGSYGKLAEFKAEFLNEFVAENDIRTVVEHGCGDGAQLSLAAYPSYVGLDVSPNAINLCSQRFGADTTKSFSLLSDWGGEPVDLALSLDVIFHLVEDEVFDSYMNALFDSSSRFVVVYSSNTNAPHPAKHVRHRRFTDWVETNRPQWRLTKQIPNPYPGDGDGDDASFADFFVFGLDAS